MGLFYTGKGDKGKSFVGTQKVSKTSPAMETLGDLDELNSLLGLVQTQKCSTFVSHHLQDVQENLFIIQANVARLIFSIVKAPIFSDQKVKDLERDINAFEKEVNPARKFVITGSNATSAWLDYARTVARRVERRALKLKKIDPIIIVYLNRLSSFFFALARLVAKRSKKKEAHPSYR